MKSEIFVLARVGRSATTNARKVGAPAEPVGEAKTRFADWLASVAVRVPDVVTGLPETLKIAGIERPTLVTVPPVPVALNVPPERAMPDPNAIAPKSPSASAPTIWVGVSVVRSVMRASPATWSVRAGALS